MQHLIFVKSQSYWSTER